MIVSMRRRCPRATESHCLKPATETATRQARESVLCHGAALPDAALFLEARIWTSHWRRRLSWYWLTDAKDHLSFAAMLAAPLLVVTGMVSFAYFHMEHAAPDEEILAARAEAAQREISRAQRRENDLECLAENIYFEARGEPLDGQFAVAEVTLNRTRAPNFPHTVCAVVHEMRCGIRAASA